MFTVNYRFAEENASQSSCRELAVVAASARRMLAEGQRRYGPLVFSSTGEPGGFAVSSSSRQSLAMLPLRLMGCLERGLVLTEIRTGGESTGGEAGSICFLESRMEHALEKASCLTGARVGLGIEPNSGR